MELVSGRIFGNELRYLEEVLLSEFRTSKSSVMSSRLEKAFAEKFEREFAITFVNGTATMHAALEALGVGPGDEVIVPALTMSATSFAVLQCNATPVFADVDPKTYQISASSILSLLTTKTKAIITVALYGLSPDMDPILELAKKRGLSVIEDNAECFLGRYKGQVVGSLGDFASFSFQSSKHLTCGEGGILVTDNLELANKVRKVQALGYAGVDAVKGKMSKQDIQDPNYSRHLTMGWNYRMSELCSAVALAQLENIECLVNLRLQAAKLFSEAIIDFEDWFVPQAVGENYQHSYWTWVARLEHPNVSWHEFRDRFVSLGGDGIYAAWKVGYLEPMFSNMNLQGREMFIDPKNRSRYKAGACPIAERLQGKLLQFKTSYWNHEDAERQANILRSTLSSFN